MVKLKIAEAMAGKPIVMVPGGAAGTSFNRLDLNKLIETVKSEAAAENTAK
jgi:hypothetical protein